MDASRRDGGAKSISLEKKQSPSSGETGLEKVVSHLSAAEGENCFSAARFWRAESANKKAAFAGGQV
ncbi:hypothetical protein NP284_33820 [Rhodopseudomonas pseudopalustris]